LTFEGPEVLAFHPQRNVFYMQGKSRKYMDLGKFDGLILDPTGWPTYKICKFLGCPHFHLYTCPHWCLFTVKANVDALNMHLIRAWYGCNGVFPGTGVKNYKVHLCDECSKEWGLFQQGSQEGFLLQKAIQRHIFKD